MEQAYQCKRVGGADLQILHARINMAMKCIHITESRPHFVMSPSSTLQAADR